MWWRIWQFLLLIHHNVSSDQTWWLPYREPCMSCQSPASAGLGSPGDRRSHSGHIGNTRGWRLITYCCFRPTALRFWPSLYLVNTRFLPLIRNNYNTPTLQVSWHDIINELFNDWQSLGNFYQGTFWTFYSNCIDLQSWKSNPKWRTLNVLKRLLIGCGNCIQRVSRDM